MKKKLFLLDIVLLALVAVLAAQVRDRWLEARKREQVVLGQRLKQMPPPAYSALPAPPPVTAVAYADIVQKNLFSPDRNPTIVIEVAAPKPIPEMPVFYGVMNLGDGPLAMMSTKTGEPQHEVRFGEKIGEFTLVSANREDVILEFDGKQIAKKATELSPKETAPSAPAAAARAAAPDIPRGAPAAPVNKTPAPAAPGQDLGAGYRACVPGDTSPSGTVRDGMRKVVVPNPFGASCRWEPAK